MLTSEPTRNLIPLHAGYPSGLGSARPGLSQKGGLPSRLRSFRFKAATARTLTLRLAEVVGG